MARTKIDWTKVEVSGSLEAAEVLGNAPAGIKAVVESGNVKGKVAKVVLPVGEGENQKQYGKAYLKLSDAKSESFDAILAEIKNAGADAIVGAYNDFQKSRTLAFLQTNYGDVTEAINELVAGLVNSGWDEAEAREAVIAKRKAKGLRVA